ncbi:MAG: hypothetical protein ACM3UT_11305 [Chloroflexota bacterium]
MRSYIFIVLFLLIALPVFSQGESDSMLKKDTHFGIRFGGFFSMLELEGGGPHSYRVSPEGFDPSKFGFNIGVFPDFKRKGHFSIQPELGYYYAKRRGDISIFEWTSSAPYRSLSKTAAPLSSSLRLAVLGKFSSGSEEILNILLGPDIRIPILGSSGKVAAGMMAGVRLDFPDEKNNYFSLEIRAGADLSGMLNQNFLLCRERFVCLGVAYIMR